MSKLGYRRLLTAAGMVAVLGIAAKGLQAGAGILMAHRLGADAATDAYFLAKILPVGAYLALDGIIYNAVIPVYRGSAAKQERGPFLGALVSGTVLAGGCMMLFVGLGAPYWMAWIAPGASAETIGQAVALARLMCLGTAALLPASMLKAVNACHGRYVLAALDGLFLSGALCFALAMGPSEWGLWPAAAAFPAASAMLLAVQMVFARHDFRPTIPSRGNTILSHVLPLLMPLAAFNVLHQVNMLAMNAFLSQAGPGAITWMNFSYNLGQIPVNVIDLVLLSTLLPFGAALAHQGDMAAFRRAYGHVMRLLWLVLPPLSLWILLERHALVDVVLRHGRFDGLAARGTTACMLGIAVAITPWTCEVFVSRCLFALRQHRLYAKVVLGRVCLNVLLCALLVGRWGGGGVAMAFAASHIFGAAAATWCLRRHLGSTPQTDASTAAWPLTVLGLGSVGAVLLALRPMAEAWSAFPGLLATGLSTVLTMGLVYGVAYAWSVAQRRRT
jgi:putative peptidoglycan lipid II flippase